MITLWDLILGNMHFAFLILSILFAMFSWTGEALCRYMLLMPIGIGSLFSFILHAFFPEYIAYKIGWDATAFQYQVATAYLGLGVAGVIGFWSNWSYALAVTLMSLGFLLGTAIVHIIEGLFAQDYKHANVGPALYVDLLIPISLALALCIWQREKRTLN